MFNKYVSIISFVTVSVFLFSCSSKPQVHLFAANIDKAQVDKIVENLEKTQFGIDVNHVPFPEDITSNAIIYAPTRNANNDVKALLKILGDMGFDIPLVSIIGAENHFYTESNIGLYLVPESYIYVPIREATLTDIVNDYSSHLCASNLRLNENGSFKIEVDIWSKEKQDYDLHVIQGDWIESNDKHIVLNSDLWRTALIFSRSYSFVTGVDGKYQKAILSPQYDESVHGTYLKGGNLQPDLQPNINCTYVISMPLF